MQWWATNTRCAWLSDLMFYYYHTGQPTPIKHNFYFKWIKEKIKCMTIIFIVILVMLCMRLILWLLIIFLCFVGRSIWTEPDPKNDRVQQHLSDFTAQYCDKYTKTAALHRLTSSTATCSNIDWIGPSNWMLLNCQYMASMKIQWIWLT